MLGLHDAASILPYTIFGRKSWYQRLEPKMEECQKVCGYDSACRMPYTIFEEVDKVGWSKRTYCSLSRVSNALGVNEKKEGRERREGVGGQVSIRALK